MRERENTYLGTVGVRPGRRLTQTVALRGDSEMVERYTHVPDA